jgi:hypothetical protein
MTTERLTGMLRDGKTPAWELDQAFWARDRGVDYPLTHYDLDHWEGCVREGDPAARAVSDPGALLRHVELRYPGHRLDLRAENGRARVRLLLTGQPIGVEGAFDGETPLADLGRAVAAAFLSADDMAVSLEQRLLRVSGLNPPPYQDWPVEEISPGRWGAVHHELRLLCATANGPDGAARHAGMNHKGDHGVLLCRERYEKAFAERADAVNQMADHVSAAIRTPSAVGRHETPTPPASPDVQALVEAAKRSLQGWLNVEELRLLPDRHRGTGIELAASLHRALASFTEAKP